MGTKWRGSAGSVGSKGYLIPVKPADLNAVISGCLVDLYASAPQLNVCRDKQCHAALFSGSRRFLSENNSMPASFWSHGLPYSAVILRHIASGNKHCPGLLLWHSVALCPVVL